MHFQGLGKSQCEEELPSISSKFDKALVSYNFRVVYMFTDSSSHGLLLGRAGSCKRIEVFVCVGAENIKLHFTFPLVCFFLIYTQGGKGNPTTDGRKKKIC